MEELYALIAQLGLRMQEVIADQVAVRVRLATLEQIEALRSGDAERMRQLRAAVDVLNGPAPMLEQMH